MDRPRETEALVALLRTGADPGRLAEMVEERGSAVEVLRAPGVGAPGRLLSDPGEPAAGRALIAARRDLRAWQRSGVRLSTVLDSDFPQNLRVVHDRPPLIFVVGQLRTRDWRGVAVIGSRRPSPAGLRLAGVISGGLATLEYTVISGLARGIDSAAHLAAMARGGRTVAVVGTGVLQSYPPENATLQRQLASVGAVVSRVWPADQASAVTFRERNALMSGLSLGTAIVEAGPASGTRVQARAALAHGRPVFLFPPVLKQAWAMELASRPGVHVVSSARDVHAVLRRVTAPQALHG